MYPLGTPRTTADFTCSPNHGFPMLLLALDIKIPPLSVEREPSRTGSPILGMLTVTTRRDRGGGNTPEIPATQEAETGEPL